MKTNRWRNRILDGISGLSGADLLSDGFSPSILNGKESESSSDQAQSCFIAKSAVSGLVGICRGEQCCRHAIWI